MKNIFLLGIVLTTSLASAQLDTSKSNLIFSGYAEVYYCYDFNEPEDHNRPAFMYSHNRSHEFNLNLGFLKAAYNTERVRANLALAAGTYMNANYAAESGVLKNIYEANIGVKLSKKKNLWIDAGIFSSHIGFESAVSKNCRALTRSLLAENSPYYESGAKIAYTSDNNKWLLSGLILNGWQHIQRPEGNNTFAGGTQITFTPNDKITLNYSTFYGNDKPDTIKQMRYFNNLYGMIQLTKKLHVTAGFDYGMEQKPDENSEYNSWYTPILIIQVMINNKWSITARGEYYMDDHQVIIATGTENGFQTSGYSLNFDYRIRENMVWRVEGRSLNSKDEIFTKGDESTNTNTFATTSFAISF